MLTYRLFHVAVQASQVIYSMSPGKSLLLGAALLFTLPPVALLAFITVIGMPIGVVLMAAYPVLLLAGYLATLFFIATKLSAVIRKPRKLGGWEQAVFLVLALLLLSLLVWIPYMGGFILGITITTGIGAWALSIYRRFWEDEA